MVDYHQTWQFNLHKQEQASDTFWRYPDPNQSEYLDLFRIGIPYHFGVVLKAIDVGMDGGVQVGVPHVDIVYFFSFVPSVVKIQRLKTNASHNKY